MGWIEDTRETWPEDAEDLWLWVKLYTGVSIARQPVCRGHTPPFEAFARQVLQRPRPPIAIWHASRGGGKSFLSAIDTHIYSRWYPGHSTRILGGSLDQSKQIYRALKSILMDYSGDPTLGNDRDSIKSLLAKSAHYHNGSEVAILACSDKSVRGDHVPSLKLDEVDEISDDHRDSAMGMNMNRPGIDLEPSALYTSTWHRSDGPMSRLMAEAINGRYPAYTWCVFEVLERCTDQRSGRWVGGEDAYENCPVCPIRKACHSDRVADNSLPKAKRSNGHYSIASLIQKARTVSVQTFRSDYECNGPKTEGLVYPSFDIDKNVSEAAEFDPSLEVYESIDSGVRTGAVWVQVAKRRDDHLEWAEVHVFADYFSEDRGAGNVAGDVLRIRGDLAAGKRTETVTDPAGAHRTSIGPVVIAEYRKAGLWPLKEWPSYNNSVMDGIALVDSFIRSGDEHVSLIIHPRCKRTIQAFQAYEQGKVNGQFTGKPRDPQHPHEEMMDALRGCLHYLYPEGRRPPPKMYRVAANKVF
jgi:hypothetical protein